MNCLNCRWCDKDYVETEHGERVAVYYCVKRMAIVDPYVERECSDGELEVK